MQYLHRRLPVLADPSQGPLKEKHFGVKSAMLPPETLPVMILCLQQAAQQIALHPEVKEAIVTMMSQAQPFLTRPRQQPGGQPGQQPPPQPQPPLRPAAGAPPPPPPGQPPPSASGPVVRPTPRQPALPPPPPAAMAAAALAGGIFPPSAAAADPLINQFGNLGLGAAGGASGTSAAAAAASSAFSLPSGLGQLVSSSGGGTASPNRFPGAAVPAVPTSIEGGSPSPFR